MEEVKKFYAYIKEELTNLAFILNLTLVKFYNIIEEPDYKVIDIIGEKVKDLLISGDILRFLQKLKYLEKKDDIIQYQEKFLEYYNILPCDLSINPYFAFDVNFREKIAQALKKNTETETESSPKKNLPFFKSIMYFREINRADSIIEKLEIMYNLRNMILGEIDMFWKGISIDQKKRYVDADNLLSIFIYLIIKSQLSDLIIDIEIINDFINKTLKLSRKGYFFSLVQSSFEYLLNTMSGEQIEINQAEYKSHVEKELGTLKNTHFVFESSMDEKANF